MGKSFRKDSKAQSSARSNKIGSRKPNSYKASKDKESEFKTEKCANDPSWYIREGQLASDVASLSFNTAVGAPVYLTKDAATSDWWPSNKDFTVPGIMSINTVPSVGISKGGFTPINIAAKNIYGIIRSRNSGGKNYDSPDLMMGILALDSIASLIMHLQRAYGTAMVYSQVNRYVGDVMLSAMGFDPIDLRANLAQFRAQINMLVVKFSAFAAPNTMTLFRRHAWMYSLIFKDSPIRKSQFYIYRPVGFFRYVETSGGPGYLALEPCATITRDSAASGGYFNTTTWTVAQWYAYANTLMTPLVSSEDIAIMCGDIIKAYGEENLFKLALINEDYTTESVFSEEILDQIHNTTFVGMFPRNIVDPTDATQMKTFSWDSFSVRQDPSIGSGQIIYNPQVIRARQLGNTKLLDMYDDKPTPERVMVATRNMLFGSVYNDTTEAGIGTYANITSCGSDICMYADLWDMAPSADGAWLPRSTTYFHTDTISQIPDMDDYQKFYRAPIVYGYPTTSGATYISAISGNIDNFTVISSDTMDKIHESAMLAMLGVPMHQ